MYTKRSLAVLSALFIINISNGGTNIARADNSTTPTITPKTADSKNNSVNQTSIKTTTVTTAPPQPTTEETINSTDIINSTDTYLNNTSTTDNITPTTTTSTKSTTTVTPTMTPLRTTKLGQTTLTPVTKKLSKPTSATSDGVTATSQIHTVKSPKPVTDLTIKTHVPRGTTMNSSAVSLTEITDPTTTTEAIMSSHSPEQTTEPGVTSPPQTKTTRYPTYLPINGICPLGYYLRNQSVCVYLCEDKVCHNDGVCSVVNDMAGNKPVALCRCKTDSDTEYSGDSCEISKMSREKERKITLGVLIPVVCILLPVLMCTCLKLKRHGKSAKSMRDKYDLNSGSL